MKTALPRNLLKALGLSLCILPPLIATLAYFPLWREAGDGRLTSGLTVLLLSISALPLYRQLKSWIRTAAIHLPWLLIFLAFFLLSRIADEMTVISFVGFVTNVIGSLFFKAARRLGGEDKNEGRT